MVRLIMVINRGEINGEIMARLCEIIYNNGEIMVR